MAETSYPTYVVPRRVLLDLAAAVLTGGQRSFHTHAVRMMTGIQPPLQILGKEYIPQRGPGVITINHYFRPGFWSPWFSAAISAVVPQEVYWTMADAWTYPGNRFGRARRWLSHLLLTQIARVYGFNCMPPMPPADNEVAQRAASVQRLVAHLRACPDALFGMAPEGGDQPGGILSLPPDGFGKLALLLARRGLPFFPAGVYEEAGCFTVRFGAPYCLSLDESSPHDQLDRLARQKVMVAIARCLPERLRGRFDQEAA